MAFANAGRLTEAIDMLEGGLSDRLQVLGPDHLEIVTSLTFPAEARKGAGHQDEAIRLRKEILVRCGKKFPPGSHALVMARSVLADALVDSGRLDSAIRLLKQNVAEIERRYGPDVAVARVARQNLANAQLCTEQHDGGGDQCPRGRAVREGGRHRRWAPGGREGAGAGLLVISHVRQPILIGCDD
jgi:Tetratricopeptide repeat